MDLRPRDVQYVGRFALRPPLERPERHTEARRKLLAADAQRNQECAQLPGCAETWTGGYATSPATPFLGDAKLLTKLVSR